MGLSLALAGIRFFVSISAGSLPRAEYVAIDLKVLAFTALVSILTAILFGFAPALQATRPNLVGALKDTAAQGGAAKTKLRSVLVVAQISIDFGVFTLPSFALTHVSAAFLQSIFLNAEPVYA